MEEIITGPAHENDGTFNLIGGLRTSMATCGYQDIAEFNRAELMIAPALQTEGKQLQRDQQIGMGARGERSRACRRLSFASEGHGSAVAADQPLEELALEREVATDEVVVLDYGGQYSQLIARRVRECGVFSELLPHHVGVEEVRRRRPKGLILSGGPASVYAEGAPRLDPELLELGIPVLGICYGMQALVLTLGGQVEGAEVGEFGRSQLTVAEPGRLLAGTPAEQSVLDVAPRHGLRAAAGLHARWRARPSRRSRRSRTSSAASTASSSTPRSSTRPTASTC